MDAIEPNYNNDVRDLKDGFEAWKRTYEYRGIKYDIKMLRRPLFQWFVVEPPEETRCIVQLVNKTDIRYDFLYHICDQHEAWRDMFYDAVDRAKKDIDWLLDDTFNEMSKKTADTERTYLNLREEIKKVKTKEDN